MIHHVKHDDHLVVFQQHMEDIVDNDSHKYPLKTAVIAGHVNAELFVTHL